MLFDCSKKHPILTVPFSCYLVVVIPLPPEKGSKLSLIALDSMCHRADTWLVITHRVAFCNRVCWPIFLVFPPDKIVLGHIAHWAMNSSEEEEKFPFVLSWLLPQTQHHKRVRSVSTVTEMYNPFLISFILQWDVLVNFIKIVLNYHVNQFLMYLNVSLRFH